ncbi:MAG: hypothetical protein WAW86_08515 [Gammaproteobacteria bacterium]
MLTSRPSQSAPVPPHYLNLSESDDSLSFTHEPELIRSESEDNLSVHPLTEDDEKDNDDDYQDCRDENDDALLLDGAEAEPALHEENQPEAEGWLSYLVKKSILAISSIATAIPNAINAFCGADFSPSDIKNAWSRMDPKEKGFSIARGVSSLSINSIMNLIFLPEAITVFIHGFKNIKSEPFRFITANLGALANALAAFALAFAAFQVLGGNVVATMFAIFNSTISYAQCFAGMYSIFNKVISAFDKSAQVQEEAVNKFEALKDEYLADLQAEIDSTWNNPLYKNASKEERLALLGDLFIRLNTKLFELAPVQYQASHQNNAAKYAGLVFDLAFATIISVPTLLTFTQTGFEGFSVLEKLITKGSKFDHMHPILKAAIGAPSGIVSAAFFALHAFEARRVAWDIMQKFYQEPKRFIPLHILKIIPLAVFNYFASGGMANVGRQITENNFLHIPGSDTTIGKIFIYGNQLAGAVINSKTTAWKVLLDNPDLLDSLGAKPSVKDVGAFFKDAVNHPISAEHAQTLSTLFTAVPADLESQNMPTLVPADLESLNRSSTASQIGMFGNTRPMQIAPRASSSYPHQVARSMPSI